MISLESIHKWVPLFERIVALSPSHKSYLDALGVVRWVPRTQANRSLKQDAIRGELQRLEVVQRSVEACELCALHKTRKNTVTLAPGTDQKRLERFFDDDMLGPPELRCP